MIMNKRKNQHYKDCWEISFRVIDRSTGQHLIKIEGELFEDFLTKTLPLVMSKRQIKKSDEELFEENLLKLGKSWR